eukprot:Skav205515  [mRNA]  locus=scaffold231:275800:276550:- [translate_table: standard]
MYLSKPFEMRRDNDRRAKGPGHTQVRKRVPTKFVQEVKVQEEEEEDGHAHVSFADEVSESGSWGPQMGMAWARAQRGR